MFKRSDESEWSRFSKALSGKAREPGEREEEAADQHSTSGEAAVAEQAPPASPSAPRPAHDVNVSISRAGRGLAAELSIDQETLIAERSFFDGTFRAEESIRIRGTVQGELESKGSVYVEEQAKVNAKVSGMAVLVAGQVNGQIYCTGRVEIKPSGRVTGEITAGTLIMQEGAFFEGQLKMAPRGEEAKTEAASR